MNHPQHPSEVRIHKKFKEYFWEFLMIFLAVTLGFLAENIRESITDSNHVSELAGQLADDLINDTTNLQRLINNQQIQVRRADSLFACVRQPMKTMDYKKLQQLLIDCDNINVFYPSTGAISTIKLELHVKQFVKTRISSHITNYEKGVAVLQAFENRSIDYMGKFLETFMSNHFTPENAAAAVNHEPFVTNSLRNITAADLVQLSVDINLIKEYDLQLINKYARIKSDAVTFMAYLRKTYDLDE
jgi:hypothetical protein